MSKETAYKKWKIQRSVKKSDALEVVITEKIVCEFLQRKNKWKDDITIPITKMNMFDFRRFLQEKRSKIDPDLFEKD